MKGKRLASFVWISTTFKNTFKDIFSRSLFQIGPIPHRIARVFADFKVAFDIFADVDFVIFCDENGIGSFQTFDIF